MGWLSEPRLRGEKRLKNEELPPGQDRVGVKWHFRLGDEGVLGTACWLAAVGILEGQAGEPAGASDARGLELHLEGPGSPEQSEPGIAIRAIRLPH